MFHPQVIENSIQKLWDIWGEPGTLPRELSLFESDDLMRRLAKVVDEKGLPTREITDEEQALIRNERVMCKASFRYWCNPPEAPIWMGDLSFKPLGDVKVGDVIIGWEKRKGPKSKVDWLQDHLCHATVKAISRRIAPLVKVSFASGRTLRCTPDHLWSNGVGRERVKPSPNNPKSALYRYEWVTAKVGRRLAFVVDPVNPPSTDFHRYHAGWLAGMYDGEGSWKSISQSKRHNPETYQRLQDVFRLLEIPFTTFKSEMGFGMTGGRTTHLRFLQLCNPVKRAKLEELILGGRFRHPDEIIAVVPDGEGEVVALETTTGNYIAWGYASKNCERYAHISKDATTVEKMYPLLATQNFILDRIAEVELRTFLGESNDGVLINVLKGARQIGASTLAEVIAAHKFTQQSDLHGLVASDAPTASAGLFDMFERVVIKLPWWLKPRVVEHVKDSEMLFDTGSHIWVGAGKSTRGTEGQRGQLGRGKTLSFVHLSEMSTWESAKQIDSALLFAVPRAWRTFVMFESTAKGRHNWWHEHWETSKKGGMTPAGVFECIFIPWYAARDLSKYSVVAPPLWSPSEHTLKIAKITEETSPRWMKRRVVLSREQLYWYEATRSYYEQKDDLSTFLEEVGSADDDETFQHSGNSVFGNAIIQRIRESARPLAAVLEVGPWADLKPGPEPTSSEASH